MIRNLWKNLHFQNQLLIIQSLTVGLIFIILISSCLYLIQLFSNVIKQELLEQLVLNSMVSTIQTAIIGVDRIGQAGYYLFLAEGQQMKNLYDFQVKNNIQVYSQLDECLQTPNSQQFYSYQYCYGLYGQVYNSSNLAQIHSYIGLQNQFIPFIKRKEIIAHYYNIISDQEIFFSQYPGLFLKDLNQSIIEALQQMNDSKSPVYIQQQLNQTGQVFLSLDTVPESKIIIGSLLNQSQSKYHELIKSEQYFNQRSLSVLDSGWILSDTSSFYAFGMQFQNASFTGFNSDQFQAIKNFANNGSNQNECQLQFKVKILCLVNIHNKQQLVFSKSINKAGGFPYYMVVIVDTIFLQNIEADFIHQLETLTNDMLLNIGFEYVIAFVICILLQIAFIYQLNRPLQDLQRVAKSHINNYQYTFQQIAAVKQAQNQTEKLAEAFFNLINLNYTQKNKQQQLFGKNQQFEQQERNLFRRQSQKTIILIRSYLKKINFILVYQKMLN